MRGMVSTCRREGDVLIKQYLPDIPENYERGIRRHFEREVIALEMLQGCHHVPQLIKVVDNCIYMSWCGEMLTKHNFPYRWKVQARAIDRLQQTRHMYHYDIKQENITVLDGQMYLIDWGMWTTDAANFTPLQRVLAEIKKN